MIWGDLDPLELIHLSFFLSKGYPAVQLVSCLLKLGEEAVPGHDRSVESVLGQCQLLRSDGGRRSRRMCVFGGGEVVGELLARGQIGAP